LQKILKAFCCRSRK